LPGIGGRGSLRAASYAGLSLLFTQAPNSPFLAYAFFLEMLLMVMALTAVFVCFARGGGRVLNSLAANGYGI